MFVIVNVSRVVDQVPVTVNTSLLIAGPRIDYGTVSQHGPPLAGHVKKIAMALLTLFILK
jgi:hypothetical protein